MICIKDVWNRAKRSFGLSQLVSRFGTWPIITMVPLSTQFVGLFWMWIAAATPFPVWLQIRLGLEFNLTDRLFVDWKMFGLTETWPAHIARTTYFYIWKCPDLPPHHSISIHQRSHLSLDLTLSSTVVNKPWLLANIPLDTETKSKTLNRLTIQKTDTNMRNCQQKWNQLARRRM